MILFYIHALLLDLFFAWHRLDVCGPKNWSLVHFWRELLVWKAFYLLSDKLEKKGAHLWVLRSSSNTLLYVRGQPNLAIDFLLVLNLGWMDSSRL